MSVVAVCYTSQARPGLTRGELDELLVDAVAHNTIQEVTGVLLHDGANFLQYFEGPPEGVARIYERIRAASKHRDITELFHGAAPRRYFSQWHMGSRVAAPGSLLALASAKWSRMHPNLDEDVTASPGVDALLAFWDAAGQ